MSDSDSSSVATCEDLPEDFEVIRFKVPRRCVCMHFLTMAHNLLHCTLCMFVLCMFVLCMFVLCMFVLCMFVLCMFVLCMFVLCMFVLCMFVLCMFVLCMFVQHVCTVYVCTVYVCTVYTLAFDVHSMCVSVEMRAWLNKVWATCIVQEFAH